jgi:phage-related protein
MKTAAVAQRASTAHEAKKGSGVRKPFFTTVQAKTEELQARLTVGRPGDRYEVEADRVADRVVDGKAAGTGLAAGITPVTQRRMEEEPQAKADEEIQARAKEEEVQTKTEDEEIQKQTEDEEVQAKAEDEEIQTKAEDEEVQAKADDEKIQSKAEDEEVQARQEEELQARGDGGGLSASADAARRIRAARGDGNPLPGPVREKMEAQFNADFSGVRIHTDHPAVLLAQQLKAQAFTQGNDIFFGENQFAPGSREGEHLLAHELTHTVQQGAVDRDSEPGTDNTIRLAPVNDPDTYDVRPEIVEAIRLARGEAGKVNAKKHGGDGKRVGWERLRDYFETAFGGKVVSEQVIDKVTPVEITKKDGTKETKPDALPSWCGIFTWWAMKKAGIPIPDWKLGAPGIDAMKLRPAGDLPRKGDIAIDVEPYNHFAMVTGIESTKDAEGRPAKFRRVATINGNTAGDDNLGGQVQERWDPRERWDHFLDPVGKMDLPPAELVTISREPTPVNEPGSEAPDVGRPAATEAKAPVDPGPRPEVEDLETGVEPPTPEAVTEALPEPDLTLPPPVDTGPAEQVAEIAKVDLSGPSDQQTTSFIDASPSAMAATQPEFGPAVDTAMKGEQQDLADNPPVLEAKTSGELDASITPPGQIALPGDPQLSEFSGQDSGDLQTVSGPEPDAFRGNAERDKELDEEDSGSFWDAFKNFLRGFVKGIRTKDNSIDTSAGDRPNVSLDGEADTAQMTTQRDEGTTALKEQRDVQTEAFRNHPGQSNIQPRKIEEERRAAVSPEAKETIDPLSDTAVADYAAAPLPQDVRDAADAKVARTMAPKLAETRVQTVDAATARDTDKDREVTTAQDAAAALNVETDTAQRKLVTDNRGKVAKLQGDGVGEAYEQVNAFSKDAAKEQTDKRKAIGDHVKSEEGKARKELTDGEKKADTEKEEGEKKAAAEKEKLEKEQEKGSWWDRVKSAIKKAVKVITDAIDKVFTAVRNAVKKIIDAAKNLAIGLINAARNWVVDRLNDFRDWAKKQVDTYLKDAFPSLARRINDGIDGFVDTAIDAVNFVADKAIAGVTALADGLAAVLDKILSTFQTFLKTAVRVVGAVMQGDFAEALKAAIEGACEIAGVDPKPVFDFLDRAGKAIMSILKDPVKFIKGLFGAVGDGIGNFFKNIKTHLIQGVVGWLTGALSEANLTGPFEFTPKGVLSIVLQVLGLTYANIKARVIKKLPAAAKVFDLVEQGYELVHRVLTEGPGALWEEIKGQISNIKEMMMGAIRNWLIVTVIKEGIVWLLSLTNPASAIVKAVKLVFDLVMFLVERFRQIKDFVLSVYEAVAAIASGNFSKVVVAVEDALARIVPVLISLLASLIGLGGIAKQVKKVIETITKPINKAIDWVVDKIVAFAKKIIGKVKSGAKKVKEKAGEVVEKIKNFIWPKKKFRAGDESHTLYFEKSGTRMVPYIRSTPQALEDFVTAWETSAGKETVKKKQIPLTAAKATIGEMRTLSLSIEKLETAKKPIPDTKLQEMLGLQTKLSGNLTSLLSGDDSLAAALARYKLEGLTATFASIPKPTGDYLTGDHQPQAAAIKLLAQKPYFNDNKDKTIGAKVRHRAAGQHAENANVINLQDARHKAGRTWGTKGKGTRDTFETALTKMEGTTKEPAKRRTEAVKLLRGELRADVSSMRTVYKSGATDDVWRDLDAFTSGKKADKAKQKETLVEQIQGQVSKGLNIMDAQPMDELAS